MPRTITKQGKNFKVYDNGEILLQNVRFSYPHLATPYKKEGDDNAVAKYTIVGLAKKNDNKAMRDALKEHVDKMCANYKGGIRVGASDKFLRRRRCVGEGRERGDVHHQRFGAAGPAA